MNRRQLRSTLVLAVIGLTLGSFTMPATAAPQAAAAPSVVVHNAADSPAEARAVAAKWTAKAMRSAVPLDQLIIDSTAKKLTSKVAKGAPQTVQPTAARAGSVSPQAATNGGSAWPGGGAVVKTSGRVFFTFQGRRASCSGDAVTSANKSTVITAGHCVKLEGAFHTDWVFVPAYNNGNAPLGTWTARKTMATPQ